MRLHEKTIDSAVAAAVAVDVAAKALTLNTQASSYKHRQQQHGLAEREMVCNMMHAYDKYESKQMHQNATIKAHRDKEIVRSLTYLAVAIAQ
jgi:hypothetical protein